MCWAAAGAGVRYKIVGRPSVHLVINMDADMLPTSLDWADEWDDDHADAGFSYDTEDAAELEAAASRIQAVRRGVLAREESKALRASENNAFAASATLTSELAASLTKGLALNSNGTGWACLHLNASGMNLAGSLTAMGGPASLTSLTNVNLSDNRLTSLEGLEELPMLSTLVCRNNRLQAVLDFPASFFVATPSRLMHADLRDNRIAGAISLPRDALGRPVGVDAHTRVEVLLLDGNRLRSLRGLEALRSLRVLSAASNQLQDTAGAGSATRLTSLDLRSNGLRGCEELGSMVALRSVDLSSNQLSQLPSLAALTALRTLDLAANAVPSISRYSIMRIVSPAMMPALPATTNDTHPVSNQALPRPLAPCMHLSQPRDRSHRRPIDGQPLTASHAHNRRQPAHYRRGGLATEAAVCPAGAEYGRWCRRHGGGARRCGQHARRRLGETRQYSARLL